MIHLKKLGGKSLQLIARYGNEKHSFPDYRGYTKNDTKEVFMDVVNYAGKLNDVVGSGITFDYNQWKDSLCFAMLDLSRVSDIKPSSNETLRLKVKNDAANIANASTFIGVLRRAQMEIKTEGDRLIFNRIS